MLIKKIMIVTMINLISIYIISKYIPDLGFHINFKDCSLEIYLFIGFIFWLINEVIKSIVKILTLPLNFITLGIFGILLNVGFIYLFAYVMNSSFSSIATIELGTFLQVLLTSITIYILNWFFKHA